MKKYIIGVLAICSFLTACEKKINPIDSYLVTVEYNKNSSKDLTGDIEANPKDSIYLNFTISSPTDMAFVEIQRNGARIDTFRLSDPASRKRFSAIRGYIVDSAAGKYQYRVLARNSRGVFMGDGGKKLNVTVLPDFDFWSYRIIQVPDSLAQTNKCYFSTRNGRLFSYADGPGNSGSIDFGYYWDTTGRATASAADDLKHTLYALNAPQPQIAFNDVSQSTWIKNATLLKKMPSSINFVTQLTSSGAIQTLIGSNMTSGTASRVSTVGTTSGNNVIGFRTANGKLGAILIRFVNGDSPNRTTQMEIDVKVQR